MSEGTIRIRFFMDEDRSWAIYRIPDSIYNTIIVANDEYLIDDEYFTILDSFDITKLGLKDFSIELNLHVIDTEYNYTLDLNIFDMIEDFLIAYFEIDNDVNFDIVITQEQLDDITRGVRDIVRSGSL